MAGISYKNAGVDIGANVRWVSAIESAMRSTYGPRVCKQRHGGFAGLFRLDYDEQLLRRNYRRPVLVGCTDGVGTKILLAVRMNRLSTIGIDLVAMNVNDLITCGAEPLFFLDYLAVHKLDPERLGDVVEGIAAGCRLSSDRRSTWVARSGLSVVVHGSGGSFSRSFGLGLSSGLMPVF